MGASGENQISGNKLTDARYDFLPNIEYKGAGAHGLAHPEDGAFIDAGHRISAAVSTRDRVRIRRWYFDQMKQLLDRLAAVPDGAGTLLDHTTILPSRSSGDRGQTARPSNTPTRTSPTC